MPREIIDLPDEFTASDVKPNGLHIWQGKQWIREAVGCVTCMEDPDAVTISNIDDRGECVCSVHGELIELPYVLEKSWKVKIGDFEKTGTDMVEDSMLFPSSMGEDERNRSIDRFLESGSKELAQDD